MIMTRSTPDRRRRPIQTFSRRWSICLPTWACASDDQASLVIASASTDHTAPTSTITHLSATNVVEGQLVTVDGTANDVGGVIGGVEVSTDGGNTWHPATGTVGTANITWSYSFNAGASGTVNIKTRAVDDSLKSGNTRNRTSSGNSGVT